MSAPAPTITPAPDLKGVGALVKRDDPDGISLAKVLLTAIPSSLRAIAATNLPAVSRILWREFLDDTKPEWFKELPTDVQIYLIHQFGPSTAWQTPTITSNLNSEATTKSEAQGSETPSGLGVVTSIVTISIGSIIPEPSSSSTADITPPPTGLSRAQKIGIGVGVPLAFAAAVLGCCFLLRRRHQKSVNGSQPPSSPGFIPRFAFQEKGEHHAPLNGKSRGKNLSQDTSYSGYSTWDDEVIQPMQNTQKSYPNEGGNGMGVSTHSAPILAPPLYHTHSSNRARGKRTSYSSLHSVAEVHELDESPVQPQDGFRPSTLRRTSFGFAPGSAQTKRKPVPIRKVNTSLCSTNTQGDRNSLAAVTAVASASHTLLRPMPDHSNSNSSSINSTNSSLSLGFGNTTHSTVSPVSPLSDSPQPSNNPFSNDYHYVEDYGPEYTNVFPYADLENGRYGGYTDLSRYPQYPEAPTKHGSRTEWPLRNAMGQKRNKSPLWDRVYEG